MTLSSEERRLHPAYIFYSAALTLRALALPLVIALVSGAGLLQWVSFGIAFGIAAIVVLGRAVAWTRITYRVTSEGIELRTGLLSRQQRFLPIERIQSIDVNETLLHRLLGVTAVKIESAAGAGNGADITLEAVGHTVANELRAELIPARSSNPIATSQEWAVTPPAAAPIAKLSTKRLLLAGATSANVAPALGMVFAISQFADDLLPGEVWGRAGDVVEGATITSVAIAVAAGILLAWTFAIATYALTFANFELTDVEGRLQASYGLLERRRVSFPPNRIQAVTLHEGLLRQPFGLVSISVESAGYGKDEAVTGALFPLLRLDEVRPFLQRAVPAYAFDPGAIPFNPPPRRALSRYLGSRVLEACTIALIAFVIAIVLPRIAWWWALAGLLLIPAAIWIGWLEHRDAGWYTGDDGTMLARGRSIARRTTITRVRRLQLRSVSQSLFQRRARLATFSASVASGGAGGVMAIKHLEAATCDLLMRRLASPRLPADLRRLTMPATGNDDSRTGYASIHEGEADTTRNADDQDPTEWRRRSEL